MKNERKIATWMTEYGADLVLEAVTSSERACDISSLRTSVQMAAESHWLPLMETRKLRHMAQKLIQKKVQTKHFQHDVRRVVRDRDHVMTHLVNEAYYEAEEHWDDDEWMFKNRSRFYPSAAHPGTAIVVANFDEHATSASLERSGKVGRGLNYHIGLASLDAKRLDVLSDEAVKEIGRSCGQAERVRQKLKSNPVFSEAFDTELHAVNGN